MVLKVSSSIINSVSSSSCIGQYPKGIGPLTLESSFDLDLKYTTQVSINFADLDIPWVQSSTYTIEIPGGFVKDKEGLEYESQPQTISFTTGSGPEISVVTPTVGTTGYNSPIITLKFDQVVKAGSGNIELHEFYTSALVSSFSVSSSRVSFRTGNCVINLRGLLSDSTRYYLTIPNGSIKNLDNFIFVWETTEDIIDFQTGNNNILGPVTQDLTYSRSGTVSLVGSPQITDTYSTVDDYTLTISPSDIKAVLSIDNLSSPYYLSESQFLNNPDPDVNDIWGTGTCFSRDKKYLIVAGSNDNQGVSPYTEGSFSIFENVSGTYNLIQTITNTDPTIQSFGSQISVSGNGSVIAFGGGYETTGTPSSGKFLKIYRKSGATWILQTTVNYASTSATSVGAQVSGDGNTIASYKYGKSGTGAFKASIEIFKYNGSTWILENTISPTEFAYTDTLTIGKYTLSNDGNLFVFSVYNQNSNTGSVYIYRRSGTTWTQEKKLTGTAINQNFGLNTWMDSNETKLYISKSSSTEVYSYTGSDWVLSNTIDYIVVASNSDDTARISYDGFVYRKVSGQWVKGKPLESTFTNFSSHNITQDLSLATISLTSYVQDGVSSVGAVALLKTTEYGVYFAIEDKTLTITLPKEIINIILESTTVTVTPDNPILHDQAYIQDFEIVYTLTTPDNRTDYKTQVLKFY